MEAITQIVADSLARHGLDRPVDPRRLQWSRWFRCDSTHSLLVVPSKPGIFALAEEVIDVNPGNAHVGTAAPGCPTEQSSAAASTVTTFERSMSREGHDFSSEPALSKRSAPKGAVMPAINSPASAAGVLSGGAVLQRCDSLAGKTSASAAEAPSRRLLAILKFSEDDDMAFTLDRMFTRINPMRERLASGRCFLRFVVVDDQAQRRSICTALNQWIVNSAEKATGLPPDFSSSLEFNVARAPSPATAASTANSVTPSQYGNRTNVVSIDSGAAKNLHCPHPLPSGF